MVDCYFSAAGGDNAETPGPGVSDAAMQADSISDESSSSSVCICDKFRCFLNMSFTILGLTGCIDWCFNGCPFVDANVMADVFI